MGNHLFSVLWLVLNVALAMATMTGRAQPPSVQAEMASGGNAERRTSDGVGESTTVQHEVGQPLATQPVQLSPADQRFMQEAYERGLFELGAAQLAIENSANFGIRLLAQHILVNRAQIHEQLKALAEIKGVTALSDQLESTHRETLERLQNASHDDDFDLRYCGTVVAGHIRDIKALRSAAAQVSDPDFKALADAIASNLKEHLAIVLAIQRELASSRDELPTIDA